MAKIQDNIKAEVVKTVIETFEDTIQMICCDLNEALNSAMFNIVQHVLAEVFGATRGCIFHKIE